MVITTAGAMIPYRSLIHLAALLIAAPLVLAANTAGTGIVLLPMDGFVAVPMPPTKDVLADAAFHMYRVGRENRSARTVQGPQRVVRSVQVPIGGGRFETSIAPLKDDVVVRVSIESLDARAAADALTREVYALEVTFYLVGSLLQVLAPNRFRRVHPGVSPSNLPVDRDGSRRQNERSLTEHQAGNPFIYSTSLRN
jgi:hypothetical protein